MMIDRQDKLSVCIATQDPALGGGTETITQILTDSFKNSGADVTLIYLSRDKKFRIKKEQHRNSDNTWEISLGYVPNMAYLEHLTTAILAKINLDDFDRFIVAGGQNSPGSFFLPYQKKFLCWIGTTWHDEFRVRSIMGEARNGNWSIALNKLFNPINIHFEKKIFKRSARILVQSKYTFKTITNYYKIDSSKVRVLPIPVDTTRYHPLKNDSQPIERYILMVGRVDDRRKNTPFLVKAFDIIQREVPDVKLFLIGQTARNSRTKKLINQLNLNEKVILFGKVSNEKLIGFYRHAELFVLSSVQEGLGIVYLEAMACGIPVVTTKCGGSEDIIIHGHNGYLVDQNDLKGFANAVIRLLKNRSLRRELGQNAREYIVKHHNYKEFMKELKENCNEVYS